MSPGETCSGGSDDSVVGAFGHTGTDGSTATTGDGDGFGGPGGEFSGGGKRLARSGVLSSQLIRLNLLKSVPQIR